MYSVPVIIKIFYIRLSLPDNIYNDLGHYGNTPTIGHRFKVPKYSFKCVVCSPESKTEYIVIVTEL